MLPANSGILLRPLVESRPETTYENFARDFGCVCLWLQRAIDRRFLMNALPSVLSFTREPFVYSFPNGADLQTHGPSAETRSSR